MPWVPLRRQFMLGADEGEQWRLLRDVEEILRALGTASRCETPWKRYEK